LETIYIPSKIAEKFITKFHKGTTQGYNGATVLIARLGQEYIIRNVWKIARRVTKECPDCQRNKFLKHKPFKKLQPVKTLNRL